MDNLFSLNIENADSVSEVGDIASMNITEGTNEFSDREPDTNHPEDHFDKDTAAGSAPNVSIPGGDKEAPIGVPSDVSIPVPGGDKETPTAKPYDAAAVPASSKVVLTTKEYDDALAALKKSFKEAYDIVEVLESVKVVDVDPVYVEQDEFMENAILTALENGPMFESVKRDDKDAIKEIVSKLRDDIKSDLKDDDVKFYKPNTFAQLLINQASVILRVITTRLWQMLGVVIIEEANVDDLCKRLTKKYADVLGEYKIIYYMTPPSIVDVFRVKWNWKNQLNTYMLIVDKKLPSELKEALKEDEKAHEAEENKAEETKKD